MNFQQKFLHLRKSSGLSQEEAANKLGVSRQAISRWEQGTALPDALNIAGICTVFGVSADYLINDDEECGDTQIIRCGSSDVGANISAVATENGRSDKKVLTACICAHIPALIVELIAIICFICSAETAFYIMLCLGVLISVVAVVAFEVMFSDRGREERILYRRKYYRSSVWLFLPLKLLILLVAIFYAACLTTSSTVPVFSVSLLSFALYFVISMVLNFVLADKK